MTVSYKSKVLRGPKSLEEQTPMLLTDFGHLIPRLIRGFAAGCFCCLLFCSLPLDLLFLKVIDFLRAVVLQFGISMASSSQLVYLISLDQEFFLRVLLKFSVWEGKCWTFEQASQPIGV